MAIQIIYRQITLLPPNFWQYEQTDCCISQRPLKVQMTIAHLPQELLGEIFTFCLPESNLHNLHPNPSLPPLLLSYVCHSWRTAAFQTPQLWRELTVMLEYVSVRSLGGGFLRKKVETVELWNSRMGALSPTLHFLRGHRRIFISNEETSKFAPFRTLFECPATLNAQALTLSDFSAQDFVTISKSLKDMSFKNLQFLSITQPLAREHKTSVLQFPTCPNLRRLYLDSHKVEEIHTHPISHDQV